MVCFERKPREVKVVVISNQVFCTWLFLVGFAVVDVVFRCHHSWSVVCSCNNIESEFNNHKSSCRDVVVGVFNH